MNLYRYLSQFSLMKRFSTKFLVIAFFGTHIPLIGIIVYLSFAETPSQTSILLTTLGLTLIATAMTLYLQHELLAPIYLSQKALEEYVESRILPELPNDLPDEVGVLMQKINIALGTLDDMYKEKDDMMALLSHDLRSPLNRVLSLVDLITLTKDEEKMPEFLEMIKSACTQQLDLLHHTLMLMKEDHTTSLEKVEDISLDEVINYLETSFSQQIDFKKLKINKDYDTSMMIKGDRYLMCEVLQNLLNNAIKFSPYGKEITVKGVNEEAKCLVSVEDEGIGFDDRIAAKLFDRFTSVGRKGTAGEESNGIGLHLSRKIIMKHKGTLTAYSKGENKGSKFTIELPTWNN
ncbi:HAMP domain-containing sensor histidine kinase [Limibacter armeniacum]|uniref:sensor histidine kinase n=1 Tax=Limibacter armeniacum TaxID=466084 RepID=UPI002FE6237B